MTHPRTFENAGIWRKQAKRGSCDRHLAKRPIDETIGLSRLAYPVLPTACWLIVCAYGAKSKQVPPGLLALVCSVRPNRKYEEGFQNISLPSMMIWMRWQFHYLSHCLHNFLGTCHTPYVSYAL
ncbi:hypothetical protein K0M31_002233 [Melipona bicolor]|uniref:Uncharacterized protein n=1 Tax=Melipona bicolor TaxID=60889 RepID=A0AA40GHU1_9HYME|nr:hypothetical protein K0M31_012869 [Melipona bicolor]KAK1137739.1 hypothetical protein K0M31_002233 [Melipona bicolor]